ncbi:MAG: hypothetical protein R2879_15555 [Saprospiraceae bacterium]
MKPIYLKGSLFFAFFLLISSLTFGQYFGKNKPKYENFDFKVAETPHFDIYYYFKNDSLLNTLSEDAEKWYSLHQEVFHDSVLNNNPILFYNNHADFQQTNAIGGSISGGTGGVTEAFKNRVIMPLAYSNQQTDHVLGHEMVHAFQYSLILNGSDSTNLESLGNLPLWMVEGLAEYMSVGRVDPHTAMWLRDAVLNDDVPEIKDLNNPKYFPYRWGQAFWSFITGMKGDDIIKPLFLSTAKYGLKEAVQKEVGVKLEDLSKLWVDLIKRQYGDGVDSTYTKLSYGKELLSAKNSGTINIVPSISPNGKYVIYFSEKDVFTLDLWLADAKTGKVIRKLTSTLRDGHLDDISFIESSGTWSPDGRQYAFVGVKKGRNVLVVKDVETGKTLDEISSRRLPSFSNPVWSPDGRTFIVSGQKNGQVDLFKLYLRSTKVEQITDDVYAEMHPSFSPDGSSIAFSTDKLSIDRGKTDGKWVFNLALMNLETGTVDQLDVFPGADNFNPVFGSDNELYFILDRDGVRNLYKMDLNTEEVFQMSNIATGISGITPYAPALTVDPKTGKILYTRFFNREYQIYAADAEDFNPVKVDSKAVNMAKASLPRVNPKAPDFVNQNLQNPESRVSITEDSISRRKYDPKFKLDFVTGGGGVGVGNNAIGQNTLLAGGVTMLFSDILGDHQLITSLAVNGEIFDAGGQLAYINRKNRISWGGAFSHIPYPSVSFPQYFQSAVEIGEGTIPAIRESYYIQRIFEDRFDVFAQYPFSVTQRVEAGVSYARYYSRIDSVNRYYTTDPTYTFIGNFIGEDREKVDGGDGFNLYNINAAYVGDNSFSGVASPLKGYRYRIGAEFTTGEYEFYSPTVDLRYYQYLKPISIAVRATHLGRYGQDANRIFPIFLGYPWFVRGYQQSFVNDFGAANDLSLANLTGSKIGLFGAEIRLPLSGPERLSLIKSNFFLTELALFLDGGMAWSDFRQFDGPVTDIFFENGEAVEKEVYPELRPVFSTGVSLRVNLFGAAILEPYLARPLQKETKWVFGLNIVPGW